MATRINPTPAQSMWVDLRRRSKGGCVDCKTAKVRCDEARPSCGTCARRRRRCRGYNTLPSAESHSSERKPRFVFYHPTNARQRRSSVEASKTHLGAKTSASEAAGSETVVDESTNRSSSVSSIKQVRSDVEPPVNQVEALELPVSMDMDLNTSYELMSFFSPMPQPLCTVPSGAISADDAETISLYFNRHPFEQVISLEFVNEMNASTWMVFEEDPKAVAEALCSIGSVYLEEDSQGALLPLTLARRARILASLKVKDPTRELEKMLIMSLALSAMEGIDTRCQPHERTSSILITYAASIINKYIESGLVLGSLAKYFIRALARHDMIMSLSNLRRNSISTEIWLDQKDHSPDRFMGFTTTLMPLLEEMCGIAEDVRRHAQPIQSISYEPDKIPLITGRANQLRSRILSWRWDFPDGVSIALSERLMVHANAYRAAALIMLFRLLHGAGSSVESDRKALGMAREVMVQLNRSPEELGLSTWPALIASCELQSENDRAAAINIFQSIYSVRKTGTSLQTLKFVTDRVWRARDEGCDWDWMTLSQRFPGECVPI